MKKLATMVASSVRSARRPAAGATLPVGLPRPLPFLSDDAEVPTAASASPDSFCVGMQLALRVGHWCSLVPARTQPSAPPPRFQWRSYRTAYALLTILAMAVRLAIVYPGISFSPFFVLGESAAHVTAVLITLAFFRLGVRWAAFAAVFERVERQQQGAVGDRHPPGLGRDMRRLSVFVFCMALVEHTFDRASLFTSVLDNYASVHDLLDDALGKPPFWEVVGTVYRNATAPLLAFLYIYNDLFVMLVSLWVSRRIQNLNDHLHPTVAKDKSDAFWEDARCSYDELTKLMKDIDSFINFNVFISFTQNLFFICFQLYFFLRRSEDTLLQKLFRCYSFAYIMVRMYGVAFLAARINDASKVSRTLLFSVSSRSYCRQVQRFIQQAATEEMALTGCNLFRVTRAFILTVAGTIATYEVIMLQMNKAK